MLKCCIPKDKITIVVSLFREKLFKLNLEAFKRQTYKNFKLILVSDGGDDFESLIREYQDCIDVSYYYLKSPKGKYCVGAAKNLGAYFADTDRVVFLDGDCIPSLSFVRRSVEYGAQRRIVCGVRFRISEDKHHEIKDVGSLHLMPHSGDDRYLSSPEWRRKRLLNIYEMEWGLKSFPYYCHGFSFNCLLKDFIDVGGFSKEFNGYGGEDQDLAIRLCKLEDYTTILDKRIICYHLDHKQSKVVDDIHEKLRLTELKEDPKRNNGNMVWYDYEKRI